MSHAASRQYNVASAIVGRLF